MEWGDGGPKHQDGNHDCTTEAAILSFFLPALGMSLLVAEHIQLPMVVKGQNMGIHPNSNSLWISNESLITGSSFNASSMNISGLISKPLKV